MTSWWDKAIIYQIYPKSFQDSNGDGIGDLPGIRARIPYLKALGINAVWLNPVFVSPQVDNGYDVANYFAIDPSMGTMADMDGLIHDLHAAGIRVILDFVLNHTSDQHPWFQDAIEDPKSIYRDYYIFAGHDGQKPNNWGSFFGGSVWADDPAQTGESYFHLFDRHMPDLNWQNLEVQHAMGDVADFWLSRGIDGLRLDAFIHIAKADLEQDYPLLPGETAPIVAEPFFANLPQVQTWLRPFAERIKTDYPDTFLLGEAASANVNLAVDYTDPHNQLMDSVITFRYFPTDATQADPHLPLAYQPLPLDVPRFKQTQAIWQQTLASVSLPTLYWNNHDMARLATRVAKNADQARSLAVLMYLQRGIPIIYYGEELGLPNAELPNAAAFADQTVDDFMAAAEVANVDPKKALAMVNATHKLAARAPMPWDDTAHQGFSSGQPWLQTTPAETTVAQQLADETSSLAFYRQLFALKQTDLFASGSFRLFATPATSYVYQRQLGDTVAIVAVSLSAEPITLHLTLSDAKVQLAVGNYQRNGEALTLAPYASVVLRQEKGE